MRSIVKIFVLCAALFCFSSCAPRGETITLDEVLSLAESRYLDAMASSKVSGEAESLFSSLSAKVKDAASQLPRDGNSVQGPIESARLAQVGEGIDAIVGRAGYTNRAAMTELSLQLRALSSNKEVDASQAKLIMSRVYTVLATELETTKFSLS